MGRAPCCDKANVKRGPWSPEEDAKLKSYIESHGTGGNWIALPQKIGLKRCGKSCRLRWLNYLRPNIKHGGFTEDEDNLICSLYVSIGSRWSIIAAQLPGRTDNDIKNYWNTRLKKKMFGRQRATKKLLDSAKKGTFEENFSVSEGFGIYPDLQEAALPPPPYSGREIPNCGRESNSIIIPPNYPQPDNLGNFSYSCSDQNLLSKNKADGNYYNNFVPSMLNFNDFYTLLNLPGDEFQLAGEIDENIASEIPHCWNNNYAPDNFSGAEILPNNNSTLMVWPGEVNSPFYPSTELCQRKTPQDWTCLEEPRLLDY